MTHGVWRRVLAGGGLLAVALVLLLGVAPAANAGDVVNSSFLGGVAIEGTDPVAYFTEGRPVEGSNEFEYDWMDATWRFSSQANLEGFKADPDKYAPQYGGYCAWAVAQGYTASIDPEAWRIEGGKLYLNYSKDVQQTWEQDVPGNITKGDANWPQIRADLEG